jgi:hypothetical protein
MKSAESSFKMEYVPSTPQLLSTNGAHSSPQHASPDSASPLLRLPGEIRNRIYEYVFSGQEVDTFEDRNGIIRLRGKLGDTEDFRCSAFESYVALTKTCRQIHQDTRLLPFKYCIIDRYCQPDDLALWMNRMDENMLELVSAGLTDRQKENAELCRPWIR